MKRVMCIRSVMEAAVTYDAILIIFTIFFTIDLSMCLKIY